ncbi:FCD domain-containing protein [Nocardioides sp. NPDC047086]|uniref:FCD domain-containing protein n=1 Tax=Nocardioides sp. NPDC047086 TaxID=3154810 RepID=UPI0033F76A3C
MHAAGHHGCGLAECGGSAADGQPHQGGVVEDVGPLVGRPLHDHVDALHRLDTKAHLYNSGLWSDLRNRELAFSEHRRIVEAIEVGDAAAAAHAASSHVASLLVRMRRHRRRQ